MIVRALSAGAASQMMLVKMLWSRLPKFLLTRIHRPRIRIGLRLKIVTLGIAGAVVAGAISLAGLYTASRVQQESDASVQFRFQVMSLAQSYLEAGQVANAFLQKHDDRHIQKHADILQQAAAYLTAIESAIAPLPADDPLKSAGSLRAGINQYAIRFQNVVSAQRVLGLNENQGLQGKLRTAVHQIESRLSPLEETGLTNLVLMMRRHEKDFILRGDEKYGDELQKRADEFRARLAASNLPGELKSELSALLQTYESSFMAFMVSQSSLTEEAEDLATIYDHNRPTLLAVITAAEARYQAAERKAVTLRQNLIWIIGLATLLTGLAIFYFGHRVAASISKMARAMQQLAAGHLQVVLPGLGRHDEIGDMARAIETFKVEIGEKARQDAQAKADHDRIAAEQRKADIHRLADGFEHAVGKIIDTVSSAATGLEASADTMTTNADLTRQLSATVAAASETASEHVQSVASATEEMSSSVGEIGRQVSESARIAGEAVRQADATNARIAAMARAAERIGDVVKLITSIAGQTNLLALNATIEAARAGTAGRGFAVVASEVKQLAMQTASATGEISQQILALQTTTDGSVASIREIGGTITRMSAIASTIAAAVEEQGAATQEIARNIQRATAGTVEVASSIADVNRGAGETGRASSHVHASARSLAKESHRLKAEVDNFLATVRAA
jgi:methyl-accepting chemotaxis protein